MVNFCVLIDEDALEFLHDLPKKSRDIVKAKLRVLENDPFPGGSGDKELLSSPKHKELYRLHIARSYTAFYRIQGKNIVILWIGTIEQAHKQYGRFKK